MFFKDRRDAGRQLAHKLTAYWCHPTLLILALPRGGVPVAWEVARALHAPLDLFIVRKLGIPDHEEAAMGAIATGGVQVLNQELIHQLAIPSRVVERVIERERRELERRTRLYRGDHPAPTLAGREVMLVDDGLATGATMRAAVRAVRQQAPARVTVAIPVAAADACEEFRAEVDEVVCGMTPTPFYAVGFWYEDFSQTSDAEVRDLLAQAKETPPIAPPRTKRVQEVGGFEGVDL